MMKVTIGIVLGFALGFLTHLLSFGLPTTKGHWRLIERYNAYMNDPANAKLDASTGLIVMTPPCDPTASLAALVAAGELSHVDLVFPCVPRSREAVHYWMGFCQTHKEIVYATGNPSYTAFTPTGTQPLHLNMWFRDADEGVVQTLLQEIEEKFAEQAASPDRSSD